jgi:hypothetical protein
MIFCCHECGGAYVRNDDDTTEHVDDNGNRDYDTDRDHVPFSSEDEEAEVIASVSTPPVGDR